MIKAVFFDIDGTLIPFHTQTMPESTRRALEALRQKEIKLFLATGRAPRHIGFVKKFFDFDGVVSFNGQYCFDDSGVLRAKSLPTQEVLSVWPYLEKEGISAKFETLEKDGFNFINDRVRDFAQHFGIDENEMRVADITSFKQTIYHALFFITEREEEAVMQYLPHCKALRWSDAFINVVDKSGGKSAGIAEICKKYHFKQDEIMAFGDGGNDVDMLEYAGVGVAMGNAGKTAKDAANYVTTAVDDDGIYSALKYFEVI